MSSMTARAIAHEVREAAPRRFYRGETSCHIGAVVWTHHVAVRFDDFECRRDTAW